MKQQGVNIILQEATVSSTVKKNPTVLLFDSGVGGLSIYKEIQQQLPDIHYIYAFDNAGFPYGEKKEQTIIERVVNIVTKVNSQYPVDIIVIACNTASTVSLPILRKSFSVPVVGVIPAIKPAVSSTRNGIVGLLATRATVNCSYLHDLISQFAVYCRVELLGTSRLVEIAEEKLHGHMVNQSELSEIMQPWLALPKPPDTIILGCTHFPLLKVELQSVAPEGALLIDSGIAIAKRVQSLLITNEHYYSNKQQNIAICTQINDKVKTLIPILKQYGFNQLIVEKTPNRFN